MEAMILNDDEKEWMQPLLDLRNALDSPEGENDWDKRDFRTSQGNRFKNSPNLLSSLSQQVQSH
jgi:hypothetical protein